LPWALLAFIKLLDKWNELKANYFIECWLINCYISEQSTVKGETMSIQRLVLLGFVLALLLGFPMAARADEPFTVALTCDNGQQYQAEGQFNGNSLHLTTSTSNFVIKFAQVVPDGPIITQAKGYDGRNLITCYFTGPNSGRQIMVKGYFTPKG
jgi:hypothetical protein